MSHRRSNRDRAGQRSAQRDSVETTLDLVGAGFLDYIPRLTPSHPSVHMVCLPFYHMSSPTFIHVKMEASRGENCVPHKLNFCICSKDSQVMTTCSGLFC